MNDPLETGSYHYELPQELIATHPCIPREHARLLVYERSTGRITHSRFDALETFLPPEVGLIFNDTKVIKARLFGTKASGGAIELLINRPMDAYLTNVYIKGRVRVGSRLIFSGELHAEVTRLLDDGSREVRFVTCKAEPLRFEALLGIIERIGHIPLPPYIQRADEAPDAVDYQSVFAKHEGAVAAPTASLHFGDRQFEAITARRAHAFLTLHVGSGTFKPVTCKRITDHPMHSEHFCISPQAQALIDSSRPLLAIGTTATRSIEYYVRTQATSGEANLFLHPLNPPQRVNHLLTNFHLPESTLMMLVASFVGIEAMHALYAEAIAERYRFYSYGDAMLIL
ncbi:MAG: tRNA preQ1(34) S-adenosylmethionine ribosyltransferase-isomerase QueA [Campylobacterales bacterium]|nr:tRNA preQ1(34) S-adenosylmethionine ribosyltransferase-isomerase QueA [Campylobacterales bacterium]